MMVTLINIKLKEITKMSTLNKIKIRCKGLVKWNRTVENFVVELGLDGLKYEAILGIIEEETSY